MRTGYNILCVEDEENMACLLKRLLDSYNVDIVSTLAETLAALDAKEYHLVVLDLNLPDSFGKETFDKVVSKTDIPIIIVSGLLDEELANSCIQEGASRYFCKVGFRATTFEHSVGRVLNVRELETAITSLKEAYERRGS